MDTLQMMLWMGKPYHSWLERDFHSLRRFADEADEALMELGLPERYLLRLPSRRSERTPDDYSRIGLYLPLMQEEQGRRFRQLVLRKGDALSPNVEVCRFRLNVLDVPEALHWYRHVFVLECAFQWWESSLGKDDYGITVGSGNRDRRFLEEAVRVASLSQSELLRQCLGNSPWTECNTVFLTNLFMYTRDRDVVSKWGVVMDASFETVHNQLLSLARTRSWTQVFRTILDGDPEISSPFQLFKEG